MKGDYTKPSDSKSQINTMNTDKNSHTATQPGTPAQPEQTVPDNNHAKNASKQGRLSIEEWKAIYRPIKNPFDKDARFDGILFGESTNELELVHQWPFGKVWTLSSMCGYNDVISSVDCIFDRDGYILTEIAYLPGAVVTVRLSQEQEGAHEND